jgi:double-stranded uracil-DNA glycosylase
MQQAEIQNRKFGLPLVADDMTEVLVMGTLPSDLSIAKQEYYANPANDFWRLIGAVLSRDVKDLSYEKRIAALRSHRIGLWDTYHNCLRPGSLDGDITEPRLNDFGILKTVAPKLRLVCFNGKEAAKSDEKIRGLGYETCILPSSSSANRRNSAERLRLWRSMLTCKPSRESVFNPLA